jgi:hypothetical protein
MHIAARNGGDFLARVKGESRVRTGTSEYLGGVEIGTVFAVE